MYPFNPKHNPKPKPKPKHKHKNKKMHKHKNKKMHRNRNKENKQDNISRQKRNNKGTRKQIISRYNRLFRNKVVLRSHVKEYKVGLVPLLITSQPNYKK